MQAAVRTHINAHKYTPPQSCVASLVSSRLQCQAVLVQKLEPGSSSSFRFNSRSHAQTFLAPLA